jgi:hypothetical protein
MPDPPLVLTRFYYGATATIGALELPDRRIVYTAEDGWYDNQRMVSCIPDGTYAVVPRRFNRGGYDAWEITGVPGRSQILIHRGNTANDVTGCIVVGREIACIGGVLGVANSAAAWSVLHGAMGNKTFRLEIRPFGGLKGTAA